METTKVRKDELVARITENRDKHRQVFEEALDGYKAAAIKAGEHILEQLRNNKTPDLNALLRLPVPSDHTGDYDAVLDMLDMNVDDEVEISQADFRSYVRDEWHWKGQFTATNSHYGVGQ